MREIRFNRQYDRRADFLAIIPADYVLWWLGIATLVIIPATLARSLNVHVPLFYYGLIPLLWAIHVVLFGKHPYKYLSQFWQPKKEVLTHAKIQPSRTRIKPELDPALFGFLKWGNKVFVEDEYELSALINYEIKDEKVGALFLESGNRVRLVFGFECSGIPSTILDSQANHIAERLERAFRDFQRQGESFTIRAGSFSDCEARITDINSIIEKVSPEFQFLYAWEKAALKVLTKKGYHQPKSLKFYLTYTFDNRFEKQANLVQTGIAFIESLLSRTNEPMTTRFPKVLREGFRQGYRGHQRYLKRLGFDVSSLNYQELYENCWSMVRSNQPDHIPVHYRFDGNNAEPLKDKNYPNSDFTLLSHLFNRSAPIKKKNYVYLPGRKKFVGVAILNSRPSRSWEVDQRKEQLFHGVDALMDSDTRDTEIIFQMTPENQDDALRRANRLGNQGDAAQRSAKNHGHRNRAAEFATEETDDADRALRRGDRLIKMSLIILCYRDSISELDLAMNELEGCESFGGEILSREEEYAGEVWSETLPFTYRDQLIAGGFLGLSTCQFDRRLTDTTQASLALAPLIRDVSQDKTGLLFVSVKGRTPLYLDLFRENPWRHMIVSAFTGYGKSVLICALVFWARSLGVQVTIFDADVGDGQGSYRPLLDYLGGAYFSPATHRSNLFEGADWRKIEDTEKRGAAISTFKSFLVSALSDLSTSDARDALSLLVNAFLAEPFVISRREQAFDAGMGTEAWEKFPTIRDFLSYASMDRLPEEYQNDRQRTVLDDCKAKLRAKLALPEGEAISLPSTFPLDCPLTVASLGSAATNDDALPTVLATQANFLRNSLSSTGNSLLLTDEISRLRRFGAIDQMVGDMWSRGRKLGVRCVAIGQDLDGLNDMQSRGDLKKNTNIYLTGNIRTDAIEGMVNRGIPEDLLNECLLFKQEGMSRRWLLSIDEEHYLAEHFANPALFSLAMNQKSEVAFKNSLNLQGNKYEKVTTLTKQIIQGTIYEN